MKEKVALFVKYAPAALLAIGLGYGVFYSLQTGASYAMRLPVAEIEVKYCEERLKREEIAHEKLKEVSEQLLTICKECKRRANEIH